MSKLKLLLVIALALLPQFVEAEVPVQQSWRCQAGDVLVLSNTPCRDGAQPVTAGTTVIYHCLRNGVVSFQQRPCAKTDRKVQLYSDVRSPEAIKSGEAVRASLVADADAARAAAKQRSTSGGVTVVGTVPSANRTAGDGKADGYRAVDRSSGGY